MNFRLERAITYPAIARCFIDELNGVSAEHRVSALASLHRKGLFLVGPARRGHGKGVRSVRIHRHAAERLNRAHECALLAAYPVSIDR